MIKKIVLILLAAVCTALICYLSLKQLSDYDTFFHLAQGRTIVEKGTLSRTDVFSHTLYGKPLQVMSWLFCPLIYLVYRSSGLFGLILMLAVFGGLFFLINFYRVYRGVAETEKKGKGTLFSGVLFGSLVLVAGCIALFSCRWVVRPEIVSMICISLIERQIDFYPSRTVFPPAGE